MENLQQKLTLAERIQAPVSPFFKPILWAGVIIAALSAGLVAAQGSLVESGVPVPAAFEKIAEIVGFVAGAIAAVSKLTVDFKALAQQKAEQEAMFNVKWPRQ